MTMLTELRNRGVADALILCCDGLKGLPDAIRVTWPEATAQTCVVHMVRNSLRYASKKHWAQIVRHLTLPLVQLLAGRIREPHAVAAAVRAGCRRTRSTRPVGDHAVLAIPFTSVTMFLTAFAAMSHIDTTPEPAPLSGAPDGRTRSNAKSTICSKDGSNDGPPLW